MASIRTLTRALAAGAAVLALAAPASAATPGAVLDQSATGTPNAFSYITHLEGYRAAQTFTPALSGQLTDVSVWLSFDAGFSLDAGLTVTITPVVGGLPDTGTALATATIPHGVVTTTAAQVDVSFTTPAQVTAGQQYAIVLNEISAGQTPGSHTHYRLAGFNATTYAGGSLVTAPSNNPWSVQAGDAWFQTYVLTAVSGGSEGGRVGYCIGGRFFDLLVGQPDGDELYKSATSAIFLEDRGVTCDPPPAGWVFKGRTDAGEVVDDGLYRLYAPAA